MYSQPKVWHPKKGLFKNPNVQKCRKCEIESKNRIIRKSKSSNMLRLNIKKIYAVFENNV